MNRLLLLLYHLNMQQSIPRILWTLMSIRPSVKNELLLKLNKAINHLHLEQSYLNSLNYSKKLFKLKSLTCLNDLMHNQQFSINLRRSKRLWLHNSFNSQNFCHIYHIKIQSRMCKKLMVVALDKSAKERVMINFLS